MSREYIRGDGSHITVTDDNFVYDSNGFIGQINQFGDFVPENGSETFRVYGNGNIVGSHGSSGNITHGNYITMNNYGGSSGSSSYSSGSGFTLPLWVKLLLVFGVLPILGGISMAAMISLAIFTLVYEEFQAGNAMPLVIFILVGVFLIALLVFLVCLLVKLIKKKFRR